MWEPTGDIVRIGTAEIEDSLVVGQSFQGDVRVILFVKMAAGSKLSTELKARIRDLIRTHASPRHVPARIIAVPDIPYTRNMKKVELAVKKIIDGQPVPNRDALKNPESLTFFREPAGFEMQTSVKCKGRLCDG